MTVFFLNWQNFIKGWFTVLIMIESSERRGVERKTKYVEGGGRNQVRPPSVIVAPLLLSYYIQYSDSDGNM